MKSVIFILLVIITIPCYSQNNPSKDSSSIDIDQKSYDEVTFRSMMRQMSWHDYLTIFYGREINNSLFLFGSFLDKYMGFKEADSKFENDYITYIYENTGTPKSINIKFKVNSNSEGFFIVESATIKGDAETIINLFIKYWPTKIQKENLKKNEWVYCYMLPDRIGLFIDSKGNPYIKIEKSPNVKV